ncbi:TIGR03749 family integrating conjugative element protein [Acidovorax sp. SUPP3334]|uniref:TIGR03749 family integrating conjugative element protein n=1 Tax=Acidovorax sp. SUPP3334 TaxID=2920881 RepID=UPI0023DE643C|nr:TIGR03749 family integrating conjugative element protein [Acidovorax sp. SUPP3334]GKT25052.1 TIGR03749 family integrating conjugative element protein [Acidovorax sp. SUPP3334]
MMFQRTMHRFTYRLTALAAVVAGSMSPSLSQAQEVRQLSLANVPPDMIDAGPQSSAQGGGKPAGRNDIDLGQDLSPSGASPQPGSFGADSPARAAAQAARAGSSSAARTRRPPATGAAARAGVERAVFERAPIAVPLPVGRERLITLPAPAALHVPRDMESVARLEVIDRTLYATALVPFTTLRIVAELVDSGQQIPMDLVAGESTASATSELEVFVVEPGKSGPTALAASAASGASPATATKEAEPEQPAADMVQLTRYAARMLYAPRRLGYDLPGVRQVEVATKPVSGLLRGAQVEAAPLGQWRSGNLYVTAVRVTNRARIPLELPLEDIRGRWISATAQHGRIGPAGSDWDTTALYLVCERAFEACL